LVFSSNPAADNKFRPDKIGKGLNFFSRDQEVAMGRSYSSQLNAELQLIDDPEIQSYIERVGTRLIDVSQRKDIEYRFFVVNTKEINAFAVPGGFIYVNRGLIEKTDTESELAGVLGHEIGHVVGRHSLKQLSKKLLLAGIAVGAGMAISAKSERWGQIATLIGGVGLFFASLKYSRDDEREADWLALNELNQAGYDAWGMVTFFEKLEAMTTGGHTPAFLSTHPLPKERKANMRQQIAELNIDQPGSRYSQVEYMECKNQLASILMPPPHKDKTLSNALAALDAAQGGGGGSDQVAHSESSDPSRSETIRVPGDSTWVDTGLDVLPGHRIEIQATGQVFWKKNSQEACGPDGVPGKGFWKPISKANTAVLIGKIGPSSSSCFVVGSAFTGRATQGGRLFLGINDDNNFDNRGEFQARVFVGP